MYEGAIETNLARDPNWLGYSRRGNQFENFRESSVYQFRNLEALVLRTIEKDEEIRNSSFTFDEEIKKINSVLDRVKLERSDSPGVDLRTKNGEQPQKVTELSSGESELVSLAIEILCFSHLCKTDKYREQENWLLLDEPDVHLHPDLQNRLMRLLVSCMKDANAKVAIATHSTTILSSLLASNVDVRIGLMQIDSKGLEFQSANPVWKAILPMFGAHPLSNIFNEKPPLIVEGEDDERIWQAAIRHSQGRVSVYPCVAGDVQTMNEYEQTASALVKSVYEHARAFSLRDGDGCKDEIGDLDVVTRFRLRCRNAENLIVSDDVLEELESDWSTLQTKLEKWIQDNQGHPQYEDAKKFQEEGWNRKQSQLKNLRNVIVSIAGSTKPWEVAVGRAIAGLSKKERSTSEHCLAKYLGDKLVDELGLLK